MPVLTVLKVDEADLPRVVMAAMQTTMIRASMTAYSTAVGPSSFFRKLTNFLTTFFIRALRLRGLGGSSVAGRVFVATGVAATPVM